MTAEVATYKWVEGFSVYPKEMIRMTALVDRDSWSILQLPSNDDEVFTRVVNDSGVHEGIGTVVKYSLEGCYVVHLPGGPRKFLPGMIHLAEPKDFPEYQEYYAFHDESDEDWLSVIDNQRLMASLGFTIMFHERWGFFFSIDSKGGYDFIKEHFLPLYLARGLEWHSGYEKMNFMSEF